MAEIRRVLIWSGWLRLGHWVIALSSVTLLISGWLIANSPMQAAVAVEYHYLAASGLVFGLVLRAVMLIRGKPHEQLSALFPRSAEIRAVKQTLLFYLSLAKQPLPHWYAHNPLWKLVYVFIYVVLLLLLFSGWLADEHPVMLGFYLPGVHAFWADFIAWFVLLHMLALFVHDYYAKTTDISAMINGYRLYEVDSRQESAQGITVQVQSMASLLKKKDDDTQT